MTIVIDQLVGAFQYPPTTIGQLIKNKWDKTLTGQVEPMFTIPSEGDTQDPWYSGQPPEIIFRSIQHARGKGVDCGDNLFRMEHDVSIHIFAVNQQQEFLFQKEVRRILQEFRRNPILKYSEDTPTNSGLKMIFPPSPVWKVGEDQEDVTIQSETHSVGTVTCVWFEHRI